MNKFKDCLERNQIIFKTIAYVLVSVLTIYLGVQANNISQNQVSILQKESEIARFQQLPSVYISISYTEVKNNEVLTIYNDGGSLRYCHIYPAVFLLCLNDQKPIFQRLQFLLPIMDYFRDVQLTGDRVNKITEIESTYDSEAVSNLIKSATSAFVSDSKLETVYLLRYFRIQYYDKFNEYHEEIYRVEPTYGSYIVDSPLVTKNAASRLIDIYLKHDWGITYLDTSPKDLMDKWQTFKSIYKDENALGWVEWKPVGKSD